MVRIDPERRAEIQHRLGLVTLLQPELATRIKDVGQRRIEQQCAAVIRDGAVDLVVQRQQRAARNQRLDQIGLCGLLVVDDGGAGRACLVHVVGGRRGEACRDVDLHDGGRLAPGCGMSRVGREHNEHNGP